MRICQSLVILATFAVGHPAIAATALPTEWVSASDNLAYGNLNCIGVTATSAGASIGTVRQGTFNLPEIDPVLPTNAEAIGGVDWDAGDVIEFSFDEPLRGVLLYVYNFDLSSKAIVSGQGATGTALIASDDDLSYDPQTGLLTTSYTGWTGKRGNGIIQFFGEVSSVRMDWTGGSMDNGVFYTVGLLPELDPNLILNGSFECPGDQAYLDTVVDPNTGLARDPAPTEAPSADDPIYVLPDTSQAIAHWEVEIDPEAVNPAEPQATIDWTHSANYVASHGDRSVDLNGTPGPGAIKQTFSTTPGATYSLLFDLAGNPVGNSVNPETERPYLEEWGLDEDKTKYLRVEVESDGVVFDSREYEFDVTSATAEDLAWITEEWTFEAVGSETTLRFKSLAWSVEGDSGDAFINLMDFGPTIDNVRVYQATIPGDLNGDGVVGSGDLDIVRSHWGETVTPGDLTMGDVSGDGYIGSADLDTVRSHWGGSIAASVPEPGALMLIAIGLSSCLLRRRAA